VGKLLSDNDFEVALQPPVGDGRSEYSHNLLTGTGGPVVDEQAQRVKPEAPLQCWGTLPA
jgi:hypothetical protein